MLRTLTLATVGQNYLTESLFYKVLNISYNLLNTILRMAVWVEKSVSVVSPHGSCGSPTVAQHHKSIIVHITSQGEDQNSKFKVRFLLNDTVAAPS